MPSIGFLTGQLDGGGGLELCELAIAEGLHRRGWTLRLAHRGTGDLDAAWAAIASEVSSGTDLAELTEVFGGIDLLYLHSPGLMGTGIEIARALDLPVVVHLHLPPEGLRSGWRSRVFGPRRPGFAGQEQVATSKQIERFLAVSHDTANLWTRYGVDPARMSVVHNGVDIDRFRPAADTAERDLLRRELGLADSDLVVGFVGRVDPHKGIEQLIAAFELVSSGFDGDATLVVVGEATRHLGGADAPYLDDLRSRSSHNVVWLGRRPDPERLYRAFDLVVVPSQWPEPFGLVAAEAMSSGIVALVADRGGLPEILGAAFADQIVEPDAETLARSILDLSGRPEDLRRLGAEGRAHIANAFSIDRTVDAVERHLTEVLERQGIGP